MNRTSLYLLIVLLSASGMALAETERFDLAGLQNAVYSIRDADGVPHIVAVNELDAVRVQGWVHAGDRLFQMDLTRREADATLSELIGPGGLGSDTQLRALGLRRAAAASLEVLSDSTRLALETYTQGVNAWVANHPLPPEYAELEITTFRPWTAIDCLVIAKAIAFSLSFDLDLGPTDDFLTYVETGAAEGFDGELLFFEDMFRAAPFDPASTIPDASALPQQPRKGPARAGQRVRAGELPVSPAARRLARGYLDRAAQVPFLQRAVDRTLRPMGSNEWGVNAKLTRSQRPLMANDPHLSLGTPSTFYQNHIWSRDGINVIGSSFPGIPFVVLGQNEHITWGATTNPTDVSDIYEEQLAVDPNSPSFFSTVYKGKLEPMLSIAETFRYNTPDDGENDNLLTAPGSGTVAGVFIPPVSFIVPRRNNGPIITADLATLTGLSLQYTGTGPTREIEAFYAFNRATNLEEFRTGLEFFDFGSQNFSYADIEGNSAYFTSAEVPVREDLQAGAVNGMLPIFIRNGSGGNEWAPVSNPQPNQAIPFEILPFAEQPQIVNPPAGFYVNANNDPAGNTLDNDPFNEMRPGGGIYYLNYSYAIGTRAGRITAALTEKLDAGPVSMADMAAIQADVKLLDAQVLTPYLIAAFDNSTGRGGLPGDVTADPRVVEAIGRLRGWDFSTPTGLLEGYDASDVDGTRFEPDSAEIANSIAATLYSVWRGQILGNTIDATLDPLGLPRPDSAFSMKALRHLLDRYPIDGGVGASGLDFFQVDGIADAEAERDYLLLKSLQDALDLLAGTAFEAAFGLSGEQQDYRWGRLHRIVMDAELGEPYSAPPAGGAFPASFDDLAGLATDGGFGAVDASSHSARAASSNAFMFSSGPVRRYVGQPGTEPRSIDAQTILPGGNVGVLGDRFYVNLLGRWLTNDTYPTRQNPADYIPGYARLSIFVPAAAPTN